MHLHKETLVFVVDYSGCVPRPCSLVLFGAVKPRYLNTHVENATYFIPASTPHTVLPNLDGARPTPTATIYIKGRRCREVPCLQIAHSSQTKHAKDLPSTRANCTKRCIMMFLNVGIFESWQHHGSLFSAYDEWRIFQDMRRQSEKGDRHSRFSLRSGIHGCLTVIATSFQIYHGAIPYPLLPRSQPACEAGSIICPGFGWDSLKESHRGWFRCHGFSNQVMGPQDTWVLLPTEQLAEQNRKPERLERQLTGTGNGKKCPGLEGVCLLFIRGRPQNGVVVFVLLLFLLFSQTATKKACPQTNRHTHTQIEQHHFCRGHDTPNESALAASQHSHRSPHLVLGRMRAAHLRTK